MTPAVTVRTVQPGPTPETVAGSHGRGVGPKEKTGKAAFAVPLLRNLRPAHEFVADALKFGKEKPPGQGTGVDRMAGRPAAEFRSGSEPAFTLQFLFQNPKGLFNIVITDEDLQINSFTACRHPKFGTGGLTAMQNATLRVLNLSRIERLLWFAGFCSGRTIHLGFE